MAGLLSLGKDLVNLLLSMLDAKSGAALLSTCKYLQSIGKRGRLKGGRKKRMQELRSFLMSTHVNEPFGAAGTLEALNFIPADMLVEALALLLEEHREAAEELDLFLFEHLFPIQGWLTCRMYCRLSQDVVGVQLKEENIRLGTQWKTRPWAVHLMLCIIDFYLPRILDEKPSKVEGLGLQLDVFPQNCSRLVKDVVQDGVRKVLSQNDDLDLVLSGWRKKLHAVRNFKTIVQAFDRIVREFESSKLHTEAWANLDKVMECGKRRDFL